MRKRILLVSPYRETEALWGTGEETAEVPNNVPPLGLGTFRATHDGEFEVQIWDENVQGRIGRKTDLGAVDLVGVTGYISHMWRCRQIARIFRERGIPVAIGGPGISSDPAYFRADFDILFINE